MHFLLRRLLHSVLLLFAASVLAFLIVDLAPGDYFDSMRLNPNISPVTVERIRSQYGLNRSLPVEYLSWVHSVLRGDWGFSLAYNTPAAPLLWQRGAHTLLLSGTATLFAWIAALLLGIGAAARPGTWIDLLARTSEAIFLSVPELVLALLCLLFAVHSGFLPAGGISSLAPAQMFWEKAADMSRHLALPCLCLAAGLLPLLLMHVRTAMREALDAPFTVAAQSYGIPFGRILLRHALPVAANPLFSLFGLSLGLLMSSSLIVETVFSWPGLGQLLVEAITERDFFLVVDSALLGAVFLIAGNFIADTLLYLNDPRIRAN